MRPTKMMTNRELMGILARNNWSGYDRDKSRPLIEDLVSQIIILRNTRKRLEGDLPWIQKTGKNGETTC